MWRYIFLLFCSIITFLTCGFITNFIQLILYFTVKPIRSDYYYRINYYLMYTYFSLYMFFAYWYSDSELYCYMDRYDFKKYFGKEHMYVIANHTGEVDWIFLGLLWDKVNMLGNVKAYAKNVVMYLPGTGLNLFLADIIYLSRKYQKDKETIENKINILMNYPYHTVIVLMPEGTRFTQEKHELSLQFAKERSLPLLKYHLTPRTKGFTTSLPLLQGKLKAVYDVTLAFKPNETEPKFSNILLGKKMKAHCYVKRIPIEDIPKDEEGASKFIHNLFVEKDKLVDCFYKTGEFSAESVGKSVEKIKIGKSYLCLLNAIAWYTFCVGLVCYVSIQSLLNGHTTVFLVVVAVYIFMLILGCSIACFGFIPSAVPQKASNKIPKGQQN